MAQGRGVGLRLLWRWRRRRRRFDHRVGRRAAAGAVQSRRGRRSTSSTTPTTSTITSSPSSPPTFSSSHICCNGRPRLRGLGRGLGSLRSSKRRRLPPAVCRSGLLLRWRLLLLISHDRLLYLLRPHRAGYLHLRSQRLGVLRLCRTPRGPRRRQCVHIKRHIGQLLLPPLPPIGLLRTRPLFPRLDSLLGPPSPTIRPSTSPVCTAGAAAVSLEGRAREEAQELNKEVRLP